MFICVFFKSAFSIRCSSWNLVMATRACVATHDLYGHCIRRKFLPLKPSLRPFPVKPFSPFNNSQKLSNSSAMEPPAAVLPKEMTHSMDATTEEEYASQAKLLQEFTNLSTIKKAWTFKCNSGNSSQIMFSISQCNLIGNKRKTNILSAFISNESNHSVSFQWSPFPIEMTGVSTIVPSPSGLKLLVVKNGETGSPVLLEIWGPSQLLKEIPIPQSVHGSIYTDGWFEGISWNSDETLIAYVAEEPSPPKPTFDGSGYKKGASDKDCGIWKGQGDWEEDWGETYSGKRKPALFVLNINSGVIRAVEGIEESVSVGQVVWAPSSSTSSQKYLVFVGWSSKNGPQQVPRKLGIKYCYNRPCALYAVSAPFHELGNVTVDLATAINLTQGISSAFIPRFSPDGKLLVFLSAKSAVDSGAHCATDSLHKMDWPTDGKPHPDLSIVDVVPVVMCPEDGGFPGLYISSFLDQPWLSDGCTMILSSTWGCNEVILAVDVIRCRISQISPSVSASSWNVLALDGDNILAVSSSPIDPPQIKYGCFQEQKQSISSVGWNWLDVSSPLSYSEKAKSLLSSLHRSIMKIPVKSASENLSNGARKPFESIFVSHSNSQTDESCKDSQRNGPCNPLILILHGGPHSVSVSSYSKSLAFLSALGFNLLLVNYRGSLGFGEEALQSLPGKVGSQDVGDVLAALDYVIERGLADPSKVAVLGGSHGGFLTTHLIGQAPDRFVAACVRNPVCNLSLMVGTTDIPDWCYVEAYGNKGKTFFTEAPSMEHLSVLYSKSPISHLSKVKTPTLFLLGAQDLRVPVSNGLQYARALKEKGVEVKVIVFPNDVHAIERPQSDFESFLNIGVWFKKYCNNSQKLSNLSAMKPPAAVLPKEMTHSIDATTEDEYASQAKLLQEFTNFSTIKKAWTFKCNNGNSSQIMFSISQSNLIGNKRKTNILSAFISNQNNHSVSFQWSPFPIEMTGVSTIVPSPSGLKLLVVKNGENGSPVLLEIWGPSQLLKEIPIPQSVHGSIYTDGWFEGISWNHDETLIAYVAEEPCPPKPTFDGSGYKKGASDKDCGIWKGQGDWEEDWGETYSGKRKPALFVLNVNSGDVRAVEGIEESVSVGQVVWAPSSLTSSQKYLVFVGWSSKNGPQQVPRKLGIKYCYNRPCALYAVSAPFHELGNVTEDLATAINLTQCISSAFSPRFSPDGKLLVFLSAKSAVDSGVHCATVSLHKMDWPTDGKPYPDISIVDVVPVVMCPEDGGFPGLYIGLYISNLLDQPWLSDGFTMILTSTWGCNEVILAIDVIRCRISRVSPSVSASSWNVLALDGDNILAVSSSPIDPPQIKYGCFQEQQQSISSVEWNWLDVSSPLSYSEKAKSLLSSLHCSIMKIPVKNASENLSKGARKPFEAIFVSHSNSQTDESCKDCQKNGPCKPLIIFLHGGPHSVSVSSYSKSLAFLSALGFNLLLVNYRGSLGFGEEALQSLPGKVGSQDVGDVLAALDYVIERGLADPSKVAVLGGSHGGFLTTHLIGQAPDRFVAASVRNPACNIALMVGTADIPDWCYVEAYGSEGKTFFTEAPSMEQLSVFYSKSPISHLSKVKTPTLFLLGAQDLRVPVSNGLQYARALKEKGVEVKVIVFPNDVHAIERPQSDFESFLNIGVWFKKYCK